MPDFLVNSQIFSKFNKPDKNLMNKIFQFLDELRLNNNREWFTLHKSLYEEAKNEADIIFEDVYNELSAIEVLQPLKRYRIYRDVRFSKDKTPYKTHFSAYTGRNKPTNRGGFYMHVEKGNCFIGAGFWAPEKDDLLRIRQSIAGSDRLEEILNNKQLVKNFGHLFGEELKTAPKGFPKDHPRIELLRKKQFLLIKKFSDEAVLSTEFPLEVAKVYEILIPFYDYMTEVLTLNENGEFIL